MVLRKNAKSDIFFRKNIKNVTYFYAKIQKVTYTQKCKKDCHMMMSYDDVM